MRNGRNEEIKEIRNEREQADNKREMNKKLSITSVHTITYN